MERKRRKSRGKEVGKERNVDKEEMVDLGEESGWVARGAKGGEESEKERCDRKRRRW